MVISDIIKILTEFNLQTIFFMRSLLILGWNIGVFTHYFNQITPDKQKLWINQENAQTFRLSLSASER